jgi:NYN domain
LDRCALFVDAGYALGDGALAVHGTRNRDSVSWDYAGLLKLLSSLSRDRTGLPLLRCYWYDVAGAGNRAAEHDALSDLPGVKVRLSKARPSRKEGVEAEIRKDLTALARNRSVSDVIVVSAEEDLAPVIAEVQEFGVRALLLHIGIDGSWAGSRALRQECDEVMEISPSHLRPYVDLISGAEPQLAVAGYGQLPASAAQISGPHAVLETAGPRLFDSPVPAGYERAAQLATVGGQVQDPRTLPPGADVRTASVYEGQPPSQPGQAQPGQSQPAVPYHQSDAGGPGLGAAAETAFGQSPFGGADPVHSANGYFGAGYAQDFSERGMAPDGRAHGGLSVAPAADQQAMGLAQASGSGGVGAHAMTGTGLPGSQAAGLPGNSLPASAGHANGVLTSGLPASGMPTNGMTANGMPANGMPANGMPADGLTGSGLATHGVQGSGLPPAESASPALQSGLIGQGGQSTSGPGSPQHQLASQHFLPAGSGQHLPGQPLTGQPQQATSGLTAGAQAPPQPASALPPAASALPPAASALPQSAQSLPQPPPPGPGAGQHSARAFAGQQNGLVPFDAQRASLPQRQLPAGNGLPYGQDRGAAYPGQPPTPGQFGDAAGQQPYISSSYGGPPQSAPPPQQLPVGEAVQSAHAEGFGFGEAVARDAPALWLEAVLARKPRMPSDLEARLLQGSALPIDSLLHDEVRHALRRGFWDALERSRH